MTAVPFDVELTRQLIAEQVSDYPYGARPVPKLSYADSLPDGEPVWSDWYVNYMMVDSTELEERLPAFVSSTLSNGIGERVRNLSKSLGLTKADTVAVYLTSPTVTDLGKEQDGPQVGNQRIQFAATLKIDHAKAP